MNKCNKVIQFLKKKFIRVVVFIFCTRKKYRHRDRKKMEMHGLCIKIEKKLECDARELEKKGGGEWYFMQYEKNKFRHIKKNRNVI